MPIIQLGARTRDFFQDVGGLGSPYKWLGRLIVMVEVVLDARDQLFHVAKDTTADTLVG